MEEKEITIDNLKINYKIAGSGPAILILHGWGSNSDKWERVGDLLVNNGMKVIIPDLPGFGKSQKPSFAWGLDNFHDFLEKFISFLNLEKFYLLGHSFGGGVAVKCCLKFPQKIEKLFLVAPSCIRRKTFKKKFLAKISKIFKIFSFLPFYSKIKKAFYRFIVKSDYPYTEGVMRESYLKIIEEDLLNVSEKIQTPTIIIWGKKDNVTPLKNGYLLNRQIKNSKLIIIPKGDHDLKRKLPENLVKEICSSIFY